MKKGIRPRHYGTVERRKVDGETIIQGCGEEVNHRRPSFPQVGHYILDWHPFGPDDLVQATERLRNHVPGPHDELGDYTNLERLRPAQEELSLPIQGRGISSHLTSQIGQSGGIVREDPDSVPLQRMGEVVQPQSNHL